MTEPLAHLETEHALLGCLMFDPGAYHQINCDLQSDQFCEPFHGALFAEIGQRIAQGQTADPITLSSRFAADQAFKDLGGIRFLADLVDRAPPAANAADYASCVQKEWKGRRLRDLAEQITQGQPAAPLIIEMAELQAREGGVNFRAIDLSDLRLDEIQHLIDGILPARGVGFIAGVSTSGKTFVGVDISLRRATGTPFMGGHISAGRVVYVAAEDFRGVKKRALAWQSVNGSPPFGNFSIIGEAPDLADAVSVQRLTAAIKSQFYGATGPGLIVIDTLAKSFAGLDENSASDMGAVMRALDRIARETDSLVMVVHHAGKDKERGLRGSSALFSAADVVLTIDRPDDGEVRTATVSKLKDGEDGVRFGFTLMPVKFDSRGREHWSCVVEYENAPELKAAKVKRVNPKDAVVLNAINFVVDNCPTHTAPISPGVPHSQQAITREQLRERLHHTGFTDGGAWDSKFRMSLKDRLQSLQSASKIRIEGNSIWPV